MLHDLDAKAQPRIIFREVNVINLESLINTIVSSTAGIVAIVSGLLISKLLQLSSEKNGIQRRVHEIRGEIKAKSAEADNISDYLLERDALYFIRENLEVLLESDRIDLEDVDSLDNFIDEDTSPYRSASELKPYIEKFYLIYDDLYDQVLLDDNTHWDDFDTFWRDRNFRFSAFRDYYELIYSYFEKKSEESNRYSLRTLDPYSPLNRTIFNDRYKSQENELERLLAEISLLESQVIVQERSLSGFGRPQGVASGLSVILYACLVSIIWPITLLPYDPQRHDNESIRILLICLFISAIAMLILYMFWSALSLIGVIQTRSTKTLFHKLKTLLVLNTKGKDNRAQQNDNHI